MIKITIFRVLKGLSIVETSCMKCGLHRLGVGMYLQQGRLQIANLAPMWHPLSYQRMSYSVFWTCCEPSTYNKLTIQMKSTFVVGIPTM